MDMIEIKKALDGVTDQVKEAGEKALAEASKGVKLAEGQKERIDELLLKQGELQEQLREVQQKQARAVDDMQANRTIGEQVAYAENIKGLNGTLKKGQSVEVRVKALTSANNSMGSVVAPDRRPGVMMLPNRRLTVRDLVMPGNTSSNVVSYMKETGFTNNAAPVAEGTRKPESNITATIVNESVRKIAHFIKASTEILADFPGLRSMIDGRLRYGLALVEENQLLKGAGTGNNLNGIFTQATAFLAPTGAITPAATPNGNIDKLRVALLQTELAEYPADGIVLNPIDWTNIELAKDTTGRYLIGDPQSTTAPRLWNRPVVATQAMTRADFLVGAFGMGAQIFDREDANVVIATENEDDFVNNLVTILIEQRLALAVYRPEAFVKGTLA